MIATPDPHRPAVCDECGATDTACARKASNGGRVCCLGCSHVEVRRYDAGRGHVGTGAPAATRASTPSFFCSREKIKTPRIRDHPPDPTDVTPSSPPMGVSDR